MEGGPGCEYDRHGAARMKPANTVTVAVLCAVWWLTARTAEARYLAETPADILRLRGMGVALAVCAVGLLLLRPESARTDCSSAEVGATESRGRRWTIVAAFILFLYATVPVGYQVAAAIVVRIGHAAWQNTLNTIGAVCAAGFSWQVFRQHDRRRWAVGFSLAGIAAAYFYFFAVLDVPAKRIHFMEYSILSGLVFRALAPEGGRRQIYLWCVVAAMLVGMGEEAISVVTPHRLGAVSDVLWDTTGGVLGALVLKFVLTRSASAEAAPIPEIV